MLNILCDVIHDVMDKRVYVWRVMDRAIGEFRIRLASVIGTKENILVNVLGTVDML